jgi:hypothetical protein
LRIFYSFATKFELLLNAIGMICAIGAGAAQVRLRKARGQFFVEIYYLRSPL